jgi:uncharacterized protein (TIGR02679 family)
MTPDELRGEGWRRLLAAARRRLESTGGRLDGTIGLTRPSDAERRTVIGITGTHRSTQAAVVRVALADLDAYLRQAVDLDLVGVLAVLGDTPLRSRPAERAAEAQARSAALSAARGSRHSTQDWYDRWLAEIAADGTLTRLVRRGSGDLLDTVAVLDALPADGVPLAVVAENTLADPKALSGTALASLVLRALGAWYGLPGETAEDRRSLWEAAGVIVDDLSSQVLVLNVRATGGAAGDGAARGGLLAGWLDGAAGAGIPFRLTLHQLRHEPITPSGPVLHVCENPAILRAAASWLGPAAAPLACTEGAASVACRTLVTAAARTGTRIRWRNDFDWPGLRMTAAAISQYGAEPWRMSAGDYRAAASVDGPRLRGPEADSPWDPELAALLHSSGRAVMEERLTPLLLEDLAER